MTEGTRTVQRRLVSTLAALLVAAAVLGACGDDDEDGGDTTSSVGGAVTSVPAPGTITAPSTLPAVTTQPTAAPTTVAPVTAAPTTVASTTSTTTTSTTIPVTTTTLPPPGIELVLSDDGLGDARFGADADEVVAYVRALLGPPTADTGWVDPFSAFGVCPGTEVRGVTWSDLTLLFSDSSVVTSGRRHFFSYHIGPPFGPTVEPAGPRTETGIGVGSTVGELKAAYPGVIVNPADDIFEANFYVNDMLRGFLSGSGDADVVTSITGGIGCGE